MTKAQENLRNMYESYKTNVDKFYKKHNMQAARRARMALQSMVPLIKEIRKEIQDLKVKLNEEDTPVDI